MKGTPHYVARRAVGVIPLTRRSEGDDAGASLVLFGSGIRSGLSSTITL